MVRKKLTEINEKTTGFTDNDLQHVVSGGASWKVKLINLWNNFFKLKADEIYLQSVPGTNVDQTDPLNPVVEDYTSFESFDSQPTTNEVTLESDASPNHAVFYSTTGAWDSIIANSYPDPKDGAEVQFYIETDSNPGASFTILGISLGSTSGFKRGCYLFRYSLTDTAWLPPIFIPRDSGGTSAPTTSFQTETGAISDNDFQVSEDASPSHTLDIFFDDILEVNDTTVLSNSDPKAGARLIVKVNMNATPPTGTLTICGNVVPYPAPSTSLSYYFIFNGDEEDPLWIQMGIFNESVPATIVQDLSAPSATTVLSTEGLVGELAKKADLIISLTRAEAVALISDSKLSPGGDYLIINATFSISGYAVPVLLKALSETTFSVQGTTSVSGISRPINYDFTIDTILPGVSYSAIAPDADFDIEAGYVAYDEVIVVNVAYRCFGNPSGNAVWYALTGELDLSTLEFNSPGDFTQGSSPNYGTFYVQGNYAYGRLRVSVNYAYDVGSGSFRFDYPIPSSGSLSDINVFADIGYFINPLAGSSAGLLQHTIQDRGSRIEYSAEFTPDFVNPQFILIDFTYPLI